MGANTAETEAVGHKGSRTGALTLQLLAHLGVAASDLDKPVADGLEQFHHAVGVPALGLHQGLAQGQPHVAAQEVLVVLPRGPAGPRGCPQRPAGPRAAPRPNSGA